MRNNVGKGHVPAGADCNLRRPEAGGETEGDGRGGVWRMSPYERRRELTPPEAVLDAALGPVAPVSGEGALGTWRPMAEAASGLRSGEHRSSVRGRASGQTADAGVYASQRLSHAALWTGPRGTSQGQNRTRENRPSGIVGGASGNVATVEL